VHVVVDLLLRSTREMRNVFTAGYHATANELRFDQGIDDIDGGEHTGARIGDIKNKGVVEAEVLFQLYGCAWLKGKLLIRTIVARAIGANEYVDILRPVFRASQADLNGFLRQVDGKFSLPSYTPGFDARKLFQWEQDLFVTVA